MTHSYLKETHKARVVHEGVDVLIFLWKVFECPNKAQYSYTWNTEKERHGLYNVCTKAVKRHLFTINESTTFKDIDELE